MDLKLHPNASSAFNDKARQLVDLVERIPLTRSASAWAPPQDSEPYISMTLSRDDITGALFGKTEYDDGRFTSATFVNDQYKFEMGEEGCSALMKLAESIWRAGAVATLVKKKFIVRVFLEWVAFDSPDKLNDFVEFLHNAIETHAKRCRVLVPLHQVRSTVRFEPLGCLVREVSGREIDNWFLENDTEDDALKLKKLIQGYCVIEVKLHADPDYASEEALRLAGVVTSMLALHSLSGIALEARFNGVPIGREHAPKYTTLVFTPDGTSPIVQDGFVTVADMRPFEIDETRLNSMGEHGLREMAELFDGEKNLTLRQN